MTASLHARPWWPRSAASWGFPVVVAATSPRTGDLGWSAGALAGGEPFTLRTTAYGASVTKQIVAALAARAVLDGGLDPESGVREHLPELPPWAAAIRVRHLVHHTGGLPQPPVLATALGYPAGPAGWAMLDNSGVRAALGRIQAPAGPPGRAYGYDNTGYPPPPATVGDGGLWTCAADLLRWLQALNEGTFGRELSDLVQTPGRLDDGTLLDYAWGVGPRPAPVGTTYLHGGGGRAGAP